jgi:predicted PurR-regulated permease PerM
VTTEPPQISSPGWTARTKRIVALICLLLIGIALWQIADIMPLVIVAVVLSYLLTPIVTFIDRKVLTFPPFRGRSHRWVAIVLTFILVLWLISLVILLVVPVLVDQLREFGNRIPELFSNIEAEVRRVLSQPITIANQTFVPMESLEAALGPTPEGENGALGQVNLAEAGTTFFRSLTGTAFGFLGGAVNAVINTIFLLTLMFYLLKDGGQFVEAAVHVTPMSYQGDMRRLFYELAHVWNAYLRGQLILSAVMGILVFLAATILGVPNPPILGLLSALLEFIPNLGPALALIPAALLALGSQSSTLPFLEGPTFAVVVIVVWTLLQNVEAVVLVPRIMGTSLNLHPVVVMIGVLAGASVAGALGVILAAPVIASLRILGQYIYGKLTDRYPFVEPRPKDPEQQRRSIAYRLSPFRRFARLGANDVLIEPKPDASPSAPGDVRQR